MTRAKPSGCISSPPIKVRAGQVNLGSAYESGLGGLPKDAREAVRLYKLSADQGNALGQANLASAYERKIGGRVKIAAAKPCTFRGLRWTYRACARPCPSVRSKLRHVVPMSVQGINFDISRRQEQQARLSSRRNARV